MDQANNIRTCKKHSNSTLEFIQIKNVNQATDKNIFYCSSCINQDLSFKGVDHLLIHQLATEGDTHIIQKWPPIDNQQILDQLIQVSANAPSHSTAEQSITNFFSILKNEISNHIDTCQKKMVNLIKHQSFDGDSILKEYQAISQICELRRLILSGNQSDLYAKEQSCKEFITSVEQKNDDNTQKLQALLNKSQRKQQILNFEFPNQIKQSILTFIDSINFFNSDQNNNNLSGDNSSNQQSQENSISEKIMKLISNKSNFCSEEFLKEIRVKLSQLSGLLSSLRFENQFKQNKKPMIFEELSNEQLEKLDEHVKYLSQIKRDEGYLGEVKDSKGVKSLKSILSIKSNFIERKFMNDFEGYLIETYPYLRNLDFEKMITEVDRFNKMMSVSEEAINKMLSPSVEMNIPIQIAPVQQNVILLLIYLTLLLTSQENLVEFLEQQSANKQFQFFFDHLDLENRRYKEYSPLSLKISYIRNQIIVLLTKQQEKIDLMPKLQLEKGNYKNGQLYLTIHKLNNNYIEVQNTNNTNCYNCISNIILEKDKKYIFRFSIQKFDSAEKHFMIGLMKSEDIHNQRGCYNYLSCYLQQQSNSDVVQLNGNYGISKKINGNELKMNTSSNEEIELRVCLQEQLLEVLDYPHYTFKYGIEDQYKQNLINFKDLRLYISPFQTNQKITLKSANIVQSW